MQITTAEAIKLLGKLVGEDGVEYTPRVEAAIRLGVEALERHQKAMQSSPLGVVKLLPGEKWV